MLDFILGRKKIICGMLYLLVSVLPLYGCNQLNGKEPYNFPNSLWICKDPYITLKVDAGNRLKAYLGDPSEGQAFSLCFGYARDVDAFDLETTMISDETALFRGSYRSYEDHLTIYIRIDNLWDGEYNDRVLYFERIE